MFRRFMGLMALVGALVAAGCASGDERLEELQRQQIDLVYERDQMRDERAEALAQVDALSAQNAAQQEELRRSSAEREAALRRAEESAHAAQAKASEPRVAMRDTGATEAMVRELNGQGYPNVRITPEGNIEVTLESDVLFGSGKSDLTEKGKQSIRGLAPTLNGKFGAYMVRVEGHTDSDKVVKTKPQYGDNFGLGSARSLSVVRFMEQELKISPERLMSASLGENHPKVSNADPKGKAKNRRVELVVIIPAAAAQAQAK